MNPVRLVADISSNNARFDAKAYRAAGHCRITIKATQGANYVDPNYRLWVETAHSAGLCVGHYHFCAPETGERFTEQNHYLRTVKPYLRPGDLLHLDLERGLPLCERQELASYLKAFHDFMQNATKYPEFPYMDSYYYTEIRRYLSGGGWRFWIAAYGEDQPQLRSGDTLWGWQYSEGYGPREPVAAAGIGTCDMTLLNRRAAFSDYLATRRMKRAKVGKAT